MNQNNEGNKGIDLSGALDDSGTGVKFEGEQQSARSFYTETPKIIQWTIKHSGGLIKDERQASYVLLGFFGIAILLTIILFARVLSGPSTPPVGPPQSPTPQSSGEFGEPPGKPF
jgi:hypothetical protein